MTAPQPTAAAAAPPNPIDRMKNDELIIAALCDGNKTIGEILKWARERGSTRLDMPLCNLIIRRLSKEGQVAWNGKAFRLTAKGEEAPAVVLPVVAKALAPKQAEKPLISPQAIESKENQVGAEPAPQQPAPRTSKWDAFINAVRQIPEGGSTWFEPTEGMTVASFQGSASSMLNNRLGKGPVRYSTSKELGGLRVTNCGPKDGKRPAAAPVDVDAATGTADDFIPALVVEAMAKAYPTDLDWIHGEIAKAEANAQPANECEKVKVEPASEPPAAAAEPSEPEASPDPAPSETLMLLHGNGETFDAGPRGSLQIELDAVIERVRELPVAPFIPERCPAEADLVEAALAYFHNSDDTLSDADSERLMDRLSNLAGDVRRHRDARAVADRVLAPWVDRHPEVADHPDALRDLWQTVYGELMKSEAA